MHGYFLTVEVFPTRIDFRIDDGEEQKRRHAVEHADRGVGILDEGIGCPNPDIGLPAHNGLGGYVFRIEKGQFHWHAAFLGALDGDEQSKAFNAGDVTHGHADGCILGQSRHCTERHAQRDRGTGQRKQSARDLHKFLLPCENRLPALAQPSVLQPNPEWFDIFT